MASRRSRTARPSPPFTRSTVPLPQPTSGATSMHVAQILSDRHLDLRRHLRKTELLPLLAHAVETRKDPARMNLPFLRAEHRRHPDHRTIIGVMLSMACWSE